MSSHTRSGREYAGLDTATAVKFLSSFQGVMLQGFNVRRILRPAQKLQSDYQATHEEDTPLHGHNLRPRSASDKVYTYIPISQLSRYRPPPPRASHRKLAGSAIVSKDRRPMGDKRAKERSKRATRRLTLQENLGTRIKGYQRKHIRQTQQSSVTVDFNVEESLTDAPNWTGDKKDLGEGPERGFKSLTQMKALGFKVFVWDGSQNVLLRDEEDRPVALLGQRTSLDESKALSRLFEQALIDLGFNAPNNIVWHRRGTYFSKMFGISFGGGQQQPANFLHGQVTDEVWAALRQTEEVKAVAERVDYLLACYFPRLYNLYTNVLSDLCTDDPTLVRNWDSCCFAATSLNLQNAITVSHRDYLNLLFGECAIYSSGNFDYKRGGHLVLWDLKLVVEFPPGCIALIPSAMIRHSNTAIQPGETRHSMTFFSASGLFRWRHNNFMSDKDFMAGASRDIRAQWQKHKEDLWMTGLELLQDL